MGNELHLQHTTTLGYIHSFDPITKSILKTISYFDIFDFPLTLEEIKKYIDKPDNGETLKISVDQLVEEHFLQNIEGYYIPFFSSSQNILKRKEDEKRAKSIESKVKLYSRIISKFPFIECVCISGSYSKGVLSKDGDVDYFIITRPGRLWLSRTLLVLFKKVFLFNSRKYFCVNYFIDSDHLEIQDKNLFTVTEISTLIPVYNERLFHQFLIKNKWALDSMPNLEHDFKKSYPIESISKLKVLSEKILNGRIGEKLDNFCFRITLKRWKKKFSHFNETDFDLNMRTRKNVSKHHPQGFQKKVLLALEERMLKFDSHKTQ